MGAGQDLQNLSFLARSIYQLELAFREEDGERNAWETSASAKLAEVETLEWISPCSTISV